ncbi:hypothetical protein [Mucilaginibacter sp. NFX135]|uniref:hypothetical protein n=1 Tax=Mucilaginibacter sp. NFX135 TaxID=3402687 RepID=UPI003AFB6D4F
MNIQEIEPTPLWLLQNITGRRLLVGLLKLEPEALMGTRFQFLRNNPLIRSEMECPSLPRTKAFEGSDRSRCQRQAILEFLKYLLHKKSHPERWSKQ